eukprot:3115927-Pleurochrysis_carterae.AAC.1
MYIRAESEPQSPPPRTTFANEIVKSTYRKYRDYGVRLSDHFNPPPIMVYSYNNTYPQDEGWITRGSTEYFRLSSLSVHRLSQVFTCEEAWNSRL